MKKPNNSNRLGTTKLLIVLVGHFLQSNLFKIPQMQKIDKGKFIFSNVKNI